MNIKLEDVNKSFGNNHVLQDITFTGTSGRAFGLLGRNGSGKTTTIRIIMDIIKADTGKISFNDGQTKVNELSIGYLPEERGLYPKISVKDQMVYFGELRGLTKAKSKERSEFLLNKINAGEYINRKLETLSKGNQQKIQLAISLISDPDILILDEPFSGLDPVNSMILKELVREEVENDKLVIFSSHQMSNVESFCDDICIINHGKVVLEGDLNKIKRSYARNNIFIKPSSNNNNLISIFDTKLNNFISKYEQYKDGYKVTINNEDAKNLLLKTLADSNIEIDSFSVIEPSLEEIFIEKAGDDIE